LELKVEEEDFFQQRRLSFDVTVHSCPNPRLAELEELLVKD
jgi:hypothetical protein